MSLLNTSGFSNPDSFNHTPLSGILPPWGPLTSSPLGSLNSLAVTSPLASPSQDGGEEISFIAPSNPMVPVVPVVPQPTGVALTAGYQFPHLMASLASVPVHPPVPGQTPVGIPLQSREFNVNSSSHPVRGESPINPNPQGENSNQNSHNVSVWSSGFTSALQDLSIVHNNVRQSPDYQETQVNRNGTFQQVYANARNAFERIYFSLNSFFDVAQIKNLEDSYRQLEGHISQLIPFVSFQSREFDIQGMIQTIRNLQNQIEDKLINFVQNLPERDQIKVVFSLPQLRDRSFIQAINRTHERFNESVISQNIRNNSVVNSQNCSVQNSLYEHFSPTTNLSPKSKEGGNHRPSFLIDKNVDIQKEAKIEEKSLLESKKLSSSDDFKSSAKIRTKFNIFLRRKTEIEAEIEELLMYEKDENMQPSTLKLRALDLKSRISSLGIANWINEDRIDLIDPIELSSWEDKASRNIAKVLYHAEDKITIRKGLAHTGFTKRDPPKFNGSVLDFPLFKKNWVIEVTPSGLPELIELNHLKGSVPSSAKDRLYEVETLKEAWAILDMIYGKDFDLRNKLKQEFLSIRILAKTSPSIEIEIYEKVHKLASRIRAAKAQNLLDSDFEYISIVYQLLPEHQKEKWVTVASPNPTWESFYSFLGEVYESALLKKQINDSCKQTSVQERKFCTNCKRNGHLAEKCFKGKVFAASFNSDTCPICNDPLHTFEVKIKDGVRVIHGTRLLNCEKFHSASDEEKKNIFLKMKEKCKKLCKLCTS